MYVNNNFAISFPFSPQKSILSQPAPLLPRKQKSKMTATSSSGPAPAKQTSSPATSAPLEADRVPPLFESEIEEAKKWWKEGPDAKPKPRERQHPV